MAKSPKNKIEERLKNSTWNTIAKNEGYRLLTMKLSDRAFKLWFLLRLMMFDYEGHKDHGKVWLTTRQMNSFLGWSKGKIDDALQELYETNLVEYLRRGVYRLDKTTDMSFLHGRSDEADIQNKKAGKLSLNAYVLQKRANSVDLLGTRSGQTEANLRSHIYGIGATKKSETEIVNSKNDILEEVFGEGESKAVGGPYSETYK